MPRGPAGAAQVLGKFLGCCAWVYSSSEYVATVLGKFIATIMPTMSSNMGRRSFLPSSAALAAATTLPAWFLDESEPPVQAQERSPNDKPGIELIGCGGRGRAVAGQAAMHGNLVAICDVDETHLGDAKKQWPMADMMGDFRKLLERKD